MATATEQATAYEKETRDLAAILKGGPKPLAELPKNLQDVEFLSHLVSIGRIEFGRPNHSWEQAPGAAESHSERPKRLVVNPREINWTNLSQSWCKSVYDLIAEDDDGPKEIRLLVRLTHRR